MSLRDWDQTSEHCIYTYLSIHTYMCVYIYICIRTVYGHTMHTISVYIEQDFPTLYIYIYIYMHTYIHTFYIYIYMHIHIYIYIYIRMYIRLFQIDEHICLFRCFHFGENIIHEYIHTYIHTQI